MSGGPGLLLPVVLGAVLLGCVPEGENAQNDLGTETHFFDTAGMQFPCGQSIAVEHAGEFFARLPEEWPVVCGVSNNPPPLTGDLLVTARVELDASEFSGPANCHRNETGTSCSGPVFVIRPDVEGAEFLESSNTGESPAQTRIALQPGRYRFQARMLWGHPSLALEAQIVIWPPCNADCPQGSLPCKADQRCYFRSQYPGHEDVEYCLSCLGLQPEKCACWTIFGPRADGWSCDLNIGTCGDIGETGECEGGVCR
jgi:hypothetical protein